MAVGREDALRSLIPAMSEAFLVNRLLDTALPIADRFRALFSLRNFRGSLPREALIRAIHDTSNLLAHEAAFALGQMQDTEAIPALSLVLQDIDSFHPIVRHEAAEALGAIGDAECTDLLKRTLYSDPAEEVRETCALAIRRLEGHHSTNEKHDSPFYTVDPAMAAPKSTCITDLRKMLLDEHQEMYERYAALFALRNRGGQEAIEAIVAALSCQSALLKHEVAYVLGQLQDKDAVNALVETLKNVSEHPMVRHEAAEALGSIADDGSLELLKLFQHDAEPIVAQSCEVALSMAEFERNGKAFEYLYLETPTSGDVQEPSNVFYLHYE